MSAEETAADPSPAHTTQWTEAEVDPFLSLKRGATEVYLIRHGDALPDAAEVVGSGYDEQGLSDLGRRQALALAESFSNIQLAAVYSSPLGRARQTADAIAAASGCVVEVDEDLREVALGSIGLAPGAETSREEVAKLLRDRLREIAVIAVASGKWSSIPGSESSLELRRRVTGAVERIARDHPGHRIAAVSHGGAINAYLAEMLGIERDYFFPAANTSVSLVRVKGQRHMLFALNDISHLREHGLLPTDTL